MADNKTIRLFEGFGIEAEYMIVNKETLDVSPDAELVLLDSQGTIQNEIEEGDVCFSNELARHVLEIKTNGPIRSLDGLANKFHDKLKEKIKFLNIHNLTLMPTAMHPWMDPKKEFHIWRTGNREIYETYDTIFQCVGHGWSNLQSVHINIGFMGDKELMEIHSAVRLILPLIPMIAASSPLVELKSNEYLDNRLEFYKNNQKIIPEITGKVIPEYIETKEDYIRKILNPMYDAILPFDQNQILRDEWLNSRGAIVRFDRSALEIRVMDIQESPIADESLIRSWIYILKKVIHNPYFQKRKDFPTEILKSLFDEGIRNGTHTVIDDKDYLNYFGLDSQSQITGKELFFHMIEDMPERNSEYFNVLKSEGNLSERILSKLGKSLSKNKIYDIYKQLIDNLENNSVFSHDE